MLRTTAFGYFSTLLLAAILCGLILQNWVKVVAFVIATVIVVGAFFILRELGESSRAAQRQRTQEAASGHASAYGFRPAIPRAPSGPGSCVHLTKATFAEVSADLSAGQMTQEEIAQKFRIPVSAVSRVKRGKIAVSKLAD